MYVEYETERLLLKILLPGSAGEVLDFYDRNRSHFEPYEPERHAMFYTEEYQRAVLKHEWEAFSRKKMIRLYLYLKTDSENIIGSVCFDHIKKGAFMSCTLGYKMDKNHCGQGYMTEALAFCMEHILIKKYHIHRVTAAVLPDNKGSVRLLEKIRFEKEGIARDYAFLNGKWENHIIYSYVNKEESV